MTHETVFAAIDQSLDTARMIAACQEVVRTPSLSFEESEVAAIYARHLKELGFDSVEIDRDGNVIAVLRGEGNGPSLMVNGHIDHVPTGEMKDPFSGELVDAARWGEEGLAIYGRGTCDMKCNVMASAYAIAAIKRAGVKLRGDVVFVADVGEEVELPPWCSIGYRARRSDRVRPEHGIQPRPGPYRPSRQDRRGNHGPRPHVACLRA
ncbi:M20 family metallopeptidase [Mesorhizobium sp. UC22_110]|uniref:M20 family metallopeptidase n=1 Tax=Mesorhizobium sp. UC22_110 TaxID=3374552 RepID=UPI003756E274